MPKGEHLPALPRTMASAGLGRDGHEWDLEANRAVLAPGSRCQTYQSQRCVEPAATVPCHCERIWGQQRQHCVEHAAIGPCWHKRFSWEYHCVEPAVSGSCWHGRFYREPPCVEPAAAGSCRPPGRRCVWRSHCAGGCYQQRPGAQRFGALGLVGCSGVVCLLRSPGACRQGPLAAGLRDAGAAASRGDFGGLRVRGRGLACETRRGAAVAACAPPPFGTESVPLKKCTYH